MRKLTLFLKFSFLVLFIFTTIKHADAKKLGFKDPCTLLMRQCGEGLTCLPACGGGECSFTPGSRKLGEECESSRDCGKNLVCKKMFCAKAPPLHFAKWGEECRNSILRPIACKKGLTCQKVRQGESCLKAKDSISVGKACKGHTECLAGYCHYDTGKCTPGQKIGQKCSWKMKCAEGAYCTYGSNPVCKLPVAKGKRCLKDDKCQKGLFCKKGMCAKPARAKHGENCDEEKCQAGLICLKIASEKVCVQKPLSRTIGQRCTNHTKECAVGLKCIFKAGSDLGTCTRLVTKATSRPTTHPAKQGQRCWKRNCKKGLLCIVTPNNGPRCVTKKLYTWILKSVTKIPKSKDWCDSVHHTLHSGLIMIGKQALENKLSYRKETLVLVMKWLQFSKEIGCRKPYPYNK